jgi:hypothetical protein
MSDIELVIKMSEKTYKHILSMQFYVPGLRSGKSLLEEILKAIRNGTLLPKEHGRIVDIGPYEGKVIASRKYCGVNKLIEIAELDTIIEADKENNLAK